jgi:hypothetical protein
MGRLGGRRGLKCRTRISEALEKSAESKRIMRADIMEEDFMDFLSRPQMFRLNKQQ